MSCNCVINRLLAEFLRITEVAVFAQKFDVSRQKMA